MAGAERTRLSDVGEFGFIARIAKLRVPNRGVDVGIGDDCAVVRCGRTRLLLTTDALIEGVHFRREWDTPAGLGRRAYVVNASDVAAMGGLPRYALLSLAAPSRASVTDLEALVRGFARAAAASGCALVGGNLSGAKQWMISVTLVGEALDPPLLRSGARAGDQLYVSGHLGSAAFGREILLGRRGGPRRATRAFLRPNAQLGLGRMLARTRAASAAIDVSDGLRADLEHVCEASGVGAVIDAERLPVARDLAKLPEAERLRLALAGGEDYQLLFAVPPRRARAVEQGARRIGVRITAIGALTRERAIHVRPAGGASLVESSPGFDHFRAG